MTIWLSLLGFPLLWLAVFWVLAWGSGWSELSRIYRCDRTIVGTWYRMQTIYVGNVVYGGMNVIACADGLCLQPSLPYRLFHPTLLFPWEEILHERTRRMLATDCVLLRTKHAKTIAIRLPVYVWRSHATYNLKRKKRNSTGSDKVG